MKGFFSRIKIGNGAASNSIILMIVSLITNIVGMIISKLLSVNLSLFEFGTYSQAMLVTSTVSSFSSFGLGNATNYFYNKTESEQGQQKYVSTLLSIECVIGIISTSLIILCNNFITAYFDNAQLKRLIYIIAAMPCLTNLTATYQYLFVSIGKAKIIAVRNFIVSIIRLVSVIITCYITYDVSLILIVLLGIDIVELIYFFYVFRKNKFPLSIRFFDKSIIREIMKFSIPLSIYALSGSLNNDIDKYVIGYFADTDTLAIYTNASKRLPFDILTTSFITVLIPVMTRLLNNQKNADAKDLFCSYLRLGSIVGIICGGGCIAFADRIMILLYDEKYLPGLPIFILYLVIEMTLFANVTIVLSATGQTKVMMINSLVVFTLNCIFNVIAYNMIGIYGPAIVTLILSVGSTAGLLHYGSKTLKCKTVDLFKIKEILLISAEAILLAIIINTALKYIEKSIALPSIATVFILALYGMVLMGINYKKIKHYIHEINKYK